MPDFSPDQIRELDSLTAPRPEYDLNGLVGLDTGLNLNMPGPIAPAPYQAIPAGQGYQMQPDPIYLGQGDGAEAGGLTGMGLDSSVPGQGQPGWIDALKGVGGALEALSAGYFGREPLFVKLQQQERQAQMQSELRKQMIQQQAAQLEEQGRQHDMQLLEKAMASPKANVMLEQLAQNPSFRFAKQAGMLSKGLKESDYGSMQAYRQFIPGDVQERFLNGELPPHELSAWIDQARTDAKLNAQEQAKAAIFQRAQNKKPEERTPYESQIVEERTAKSDLQRADIELKKAQAAKAQREAETGPPDHSVLNRVHQQLTGGKSYEMGTPETQSQALKQYAEMNAQGRTNVQMGTVPALKEQADFYTIKGLENLELEQAPKGLTEGQYRNGPYRQLDDKEKDAVVQYKVAQKTVDTMNRVANQLITATTPAQALKQKIALEAGAYTGRNGLASAYQKDRDAFSSRMARLVEVGVLTNTDVTRWSDTFGSFGDTVQTLKAKQALFGEIQDETQRMLKLKLGGKPITSAARSKLDALLDKANQYRSVEDDANILFGGGKK